MTPVAVVTNTMFQIPRKIPRKFQTRNSEFLTYSATQLLFLWFCGLRKKSHIRVIMVMFICMHDEEFSIMFAQDHKKLKIHKKLKKKNSYISRQARVSSH